MPVTVPMSNITMSEQDWMSVSPTKIMEEHFGKQPFKFPGSTSCTVTKHSTQTFSSSGGTIDPTPQSTEKSESVKTTSSKESKTTAENRKNENQNDNEIMEKSVTLRKHSIENRQIEDSQKSVTSASGDVTYGNDKVEIKLNVKHYTPENLTVKAVDSYLVIEGKKEEVSDKTHSGTVTRQFIRRYGLPSDSRPEEITCNLTTDGNLIVVVPRIEKLELKESVIPILKQKEQRSYSSSSTTSSSSGDRSR